jgi:hypothetical protein
MEIMTVINFRSASNLEESQEELEKHYNWLIGYGDKGKGHFRMINGHSECHKNYPTHYPVDVFGTELKWMNESFPKETYEWYLWFESVFLVPEEMASLLMLKWK